MRLHDPLGVRPIKSLGKKGRTLKKARKFFATKKARKSKKQGKEDQGTFVGNSEGRDWTFQSRLKISSEIDFFSIFAPLGCWKSTKSRATIACQYTLRAQRLKKFNLAWNLQSRLNFQISLENFNPDRPNFPTENKGFGERLAWNFQGGSFFTYSWSFFAYS